MRPRNWARNRLIAGSLLLFAGRLLVSLPRSGPVVVADEIGYLTDARVLVGGLAGQLHLAPFYRGGYPLLISPIVGAVSDPELSYHLILALNAILAASLFPLLYVLLNRFLGVSPGIALGTAFAGALYPAVTVLSQVAMSENALFPLVCAWLIAWGGLLAASESRALPWALAVGTTTVALWAVHGRMIAALAITVALLLWLAAVRRLRPAPVLAALALVGVGLLGTHFLDNFFVEHNYGGHATPEAHERLSGLFAGHRLLTTAANLLGQTWYLVVATFGLGAVVVWDVLSCVRRVGTGRPAPVAAILVALTFLLLLISAAAFPVRTRPDMLIYGRYAEVVAPPLVAVGLATLAAKSSATRLFRPLLALVALTGAVALVRMTASDPGVANRWNISALPFLTFQLGPGVVVGAGLVTAIGAWALLRASRRSSSAVAWLAAVFLLAVVAYGLWNPVHTTQRTAYPGGWTSPETTAADHGITSISYDLDHYDTLGLYPVQWFLPHTAETLFHAGRQAPASLYVLSATSWNSEHPRCHATALWRAAGRDEAIWRLQNPARAGRGRPAHGC